MSWTCWPAKVLLLSLEAVALARGQQKPSATFNKHVAPIVYQSCAPCHRPGESAPFSLLTYQDVKKRAQQIARVTKSRYMPPWLPEPGFGEFSGSRRLSDRDIEVIQEWVSAGAVEGEPRDLPPIPKLTQGWQLGEPDLVLEMPQPYLLAAGGRDVFRNFVIPVPLTRTRYVKAIEIRPGNKRIVHHANILVDRKRACRRLDALDPEVGFGGMNVTIESDVFEPDSHFLFWKPGAPPFTEPADTTWPLDGSTDLVLNVHLQPSGKPEPIQASVGLYFSDTPPAKHPMLLQLEHDGAIDIPPGKKDFVITDEFELPVDVDVLGVYPHAHYLGKELRGYATLPSGEKKWLIYIKNWDLNWQGVYRYSKPVFLPKGAKIAIRYTYDNSSDNVRNPNHPPKRVVAGNQSTDEMGHLWVQVLPRGREDSRPVLQKALMQRRLEKYPGDFVAHFNLGSVLLNESQSSEAIVQFREALKADPASAAAQNSLGVALESQGKREAAMEQYQLALRTSPDHQDARYNLANLLALQGKLEEAIGHYRDLLKSNPNDGAARKRFSTALQAVGGRLASQGKVEEAIRRFREAAEVQPDDADAHSDLGTALALTGNLVEAAAQFEWALRINPAHEVARKNLKLARERLAKSQ